MKPTKALIVTVFLVASLGCARSAGSSTPAARFDAEQAAAGTGHLNFAPYSKEEQTAIRALKPVGAWIPVTIGRGYLILREHGITLERGDYSVQFLADSAGNVGKFLLAKNRDVKLASIDLPEAKAPDGSFAEVLDFVAQVRTLHPFPDTLAYISASGESGAIWVHVANESIERRGELFGLRNIGPGRKR